MGQRTDRIFAAKPPEVLKASVELIFPSSLSLYRSQRKTSMPASDQKATHWRWRNLPLLCWFLGHTPAPRNGLIALLESAYFPDESPPLNVTLCERCRGLYCYDVLEQSIDDQMVTR